MIVQVIPQRSDQVKREGPLSEGDVRMRLHDLLDEYGMSLG